ncbi:Glu/Leu/Phe/Val dehydrogenase [Reinekea marina]|uniref:Leu/Phe/Val dehydrogenase n=1 Tax=Reinekea marina TaxID=1310421 RepID=A0ABV7WV64_9GAMM|nr:Glu/Leu/Phe/Val dehydrogenase [Reinekea marina]MDN3647387.1 Glu/Leu/Phe/Val dehydrogenase [Reinekea marina]
MSFFTHKDFDNHEQVCYFSDQDSGLKAIIAVHNTQLGPSLGGTRFFDYASDEDALTDALRLSRGMTYKSAMARLPLGGGKSVIIGNPKTLKSEALLKAFGNALERLNGIYVAAEDSGTSVPDMKVIHQQTEHVTGYHEKVASDGGSKSGDPSPATAYGCYLGIKAAVKHKFKRDDIAGLRIGVQGLGNVGYRLAEFLHQDGAHIIACDLNEAALEKAKQELNAEIVGLNDIYSQPMDIFAPCAMGATVNPETLKQLNVTIIAGSANNQLDTLKTGEELHTSGTLYAPDYVINAGGIIDVCYEHLGLYEAEKVNKHIEGIYDTLIEIFERSEKDNIPTALLADTIARERLNQGVPTLA